MIPLILIGLLPASTVAVCYSLLELMGIRFKTKSKLAAIAIVIIVTLWIWRRFYTLI